MYFEMLVNTMLQIWYIDQRTKIFVKKGNFHHFHLFLIQKSIILQMIRKKIWIDVDPHRILVILIYISAFPSKENTEGTPLFSHCVMNCLTLQKCYDGGSGKDGIVVLQKCVESEVFEWETNWLLVVSSPLLSLGALWLETISSFSVDLWRVDITSFLFI